MTSTTRATFSAILLAVLVVLALLIVLPFASFLLAAVLLAFVLYPLQERLTDRVGSTASAAALVGTTVLAVVLPVAAFVVVAAADLTALAEGQQALPGLQAVESTLQSRFGVDVALRSRLRSLAGRIPSFVAGVAPRLLGTGVHLFLGVLLALFVQYYLLKDGRALVEWVRETVPLPPAVSEELLEAARRMTWAVMKGHVLVALVQGFVAGLALIAVGIPSAVLWTAVMMVLALIPVLGVATILGGAIVYLAVQGDLVAAGFVLVWGLTVVALTDDYLRAYAIKRQAASLHPALILVGVVGAAVAFGTMGLFYGPVVLGVLKTTVETFHEHYDVR